nr:Serine/threonine protein kinase [Streptococcus thermophilus]
MSDLAAGDVLEGRYVVDRPIARGGMSTVYRCLDTRLDREVAAKVMHARYVDDPLFLDRFQREARAMAQMSHPNLVNVYDFSSHGEDVFLIMELITGGTLRELLAERGPMPPHAAAEVMRSMLTGLSVAHRRGLVHRDIKPDNILINGDNSVKLADFGLVRAASESQRSTDQIVGTVAYLSPEQVDGSELTQASDVYSSGIVLFELLTGTQPFSGETSLAHAMARLHRDVPPPSSRIAGIPMLFDELVATATARHPRDRFADADEFLDALEDVSADLDLPDFTVPAPTQSAAHRVAAIPTGITHVEDARTDSPAAETRYDHGPMREPDPHPEPVRETEPSPYQEPHHQNFQQPYRPPAPAPVPAHVPVPAQAPMHQPEAPRIPEPETNRSKAATAIVVLLTIAATAAIAVGGWWYGSGWYGQIPEIIRMPDYY